MLKEGRLVLVRSAIAALAITVLVAAQAPQTGTHPISYLSNGTPSFFSRSVESLSPSYSSEHRVIIYAIHNPQPNQSVISVNRTRASGDR